MISSLFKYSLLLTVIMTTSVSAINLSAVELTKPIQQHLVQEQLAQLESSAGGRLGVAALNTVNNQRIEYRSEERFPLCSTSKVMAVAAILHNSSTDAKLLATNLRYTQQDVAASGYAPIASKHVATGMTVGAMCQATLNYSDNLAMNLLLRKLGGPKSVTAYARSIGDTSYSLDRKEPELNSAIPSDLRDTTTPLAMQNSLQTLVLGNSLAPTQREQLQGWLKNNTTGKSRISAGVPKTWLVGDKTGTGKYGTSNDVGEIWPTGAQPIVLAIYFTQNKPDAKANDQVIVDATRIIVAEFAKTDAKLKLN